MPAERLFFDDHQWAVVREATACLIPGPQDDDREAGHPGAREADVVRYIDRLLAALDHRPPLLFAGGPWSDRAGGTVNHTARFTALSPPQRFGWQRRLTAWREEYRTGIELLDRLADKPFELTDAVERDRVLRHEHAVPFRDTLFDHAVEGMYALPEYGGNRALVGWHDIAFRGDNLPDGYAARRVSQSDGPDPVAERDLAGRLATCFDVAVRHVVSGGRDG